MTSLTRSALCVLSLGLIAGYVDAVGYVELRGIFTAAMTGNATTFGISLADGNWFRAASVGTVLGLFLRCAGGKPAAAGAARVPVMNGSGWRVCLLLPR